MWKHKKWKHSKNEHKGEKWGKECEVKLGRKWTKNMSKNSVQWQFMDYVLWTAFTNHVCQPCPQSMSANYVCNPHLWPISTNCIHGPHSPVTSTNSSPYSFCKQSTRKYHEVASEFLISLCNPTVGCNSYEKLCNSHIGRLQYFSWGSAMMGTRMVGPPADPH